MYLFNKIRSVGNTVATFEDNIMHLLNESRPVGNKPDTIVDNIMHLFKHKYISRE